MSTITRFFATAPKGIAPLLADELRALGASGVSETAAGIYFDGSLALAYRACLWSRTANRILMPLGSFAAPTPEALYEAVRTVAWDQHLAPEGTLAVDCTSVQSAISHSHYGALKVKDAVVDQFRERHGVRPSVALDRPDVRIHVYLHRDQATVSLDLSGGSLHRRGYRLEGVAAPLKENLAAAILLRAGWPEIARAGGALVDPMCGSGTLPIEGALIAADIAPGLLRGYFGFLRWRGHDQGVWRELLAEAEERRARGLTQLPMILGCDADAEAVRVALANAARAGLAGRIRLEPRALAACTPPAGAATGLVIMNPPYGERLGERERLAELYGAIGETLKRGFAGWKAAILSGNPELGRRIGLYTRRAHVFYNGAIECRLLRFEVEPRWFARPAEPAAAAAPADAEDGGRGGEMFANRLRKNLKHLGRWARRAGVTCYRLYDADMPEYALAVDLYQGEQLWAHVQEYEAPPSIAPARARARLQEALRVIPEVLGIPPAQMFFKVRRRQKGTSQYEKLGAEGRFHEVREGPCRLWVNFSDYLDTGLFLDHRPTRELIHGLARGRRFLNLFGYTGAATVHAAAGGARATTTVDLSNTYLAWARRNLALNGYTGPEHALIQADCLEWLAAQARSPSPPAYDLIFLDPPTFSTSKRMTETLDVQRDHTGLIRDAAALLAPGGILIFSNNHRHFKMDRAALPGLAIEDITAATIPQDYTRNPRIHNCWKITRA